jgi:ectoine hydroxylase-related dioxygenase (phytanoyl-CoA dioxygenase family)
MSIDSGTLPDDSPANSPANSSNVHSHLTPEQVAFYDENGYLVLPGLVPPDLLERLRSAGDRWIESGHGLDGAPDGADYQFTDRPTGRVMFRVDYLHDKGEPVSLELLGAPEILGVAESLAGPNFVPTYESMVFKNSGDGAAIHWHQDAVHPRKSRIFNVDIYLDESAAGAGALRVVPGSHRQVADICTLEDAYEWDIPGSIEVPLQPGDVLIHDVMLIHGSPPTLGNKLRRTIYYEFRAAEQILTEGPWDAEWVDRRLRLIPLGLAEHALARPDVRQFDWTPDASLRPLPGTDRADELRIIHVGHTPGSYCSAGSVDPLPVPAATG